MTGWLAGFLALDRLARICEKHRATAVFRQRFVSAAG